MLAHGAGGHGGALGPGDTHASCSQVQSPLQYAEPRYFPSLSYGQALQSAAWWPPHLTSAGGDGGADGGDGGESGDGGGEHRPVAFGDV